jgi:hypothetical protein
MGNHEQGYYVGAGNVRVGTAGRADDLIHLEIRGETQIFVPQGQRDRGPCGFLQPGQRKVRIIMITADVD